MNNNLKAVSVLIGYAGLLLACGQVETEKKTELDSEPAANIPPSTEESFTTDYGTSVEKSVQRALSKLSPEQLELLNKTPLSAKRYPSPPEPNYGPKPGSIRFIDTDPSETIGGTITMKPAVDAEGNRVDETASGITAYSIHWGLEVGKPGKEDDKGSGDLGGDCMGFRDTNFVFKTPASSTTAVFSWEIPSGTVVPKNAVYFVGQAHYEKIINLKKCTQTPIENLIAE